MKMIQLTDEEFYMIKSIIEREERRIRGIPRKRKWIKQNGIMVNTETGNAIDIASNRLCIQSSAELLPELVPDIGSQTEAAHLGCAPQADS